ncbi:branched-chain amino acid ABC transporter permease, partial [Mesorhizobium sp. M2D.F.Ca.ET.145.01.1.1]
MTDMTSPITQIRTAAATPIAPGRTPWKHEAVGFVLGFV